MNPILGTLRRGWLVPMLDLGRLGTAYYRVVFRGAGLRSGILQQLAGSPSTAAQLAERMGYRPGLEDALAAWLDAGVSCGELSRRGGRYAIRSRALRRLLRPGNDPVAAFTEEMAGLHHRLLWEAPERLRSGELLEIGDADPAVIARSSRLGEPWIDAALEQFVPRHGTVRLLEVGCGSGAHIRTAARLNPSLLVTGLDLQEPAAALARENLAGWGLAGRTEVVCCDVRDHAPSQPYDLITLHQNVYYFTEEQQVALFTHLRGLLAPGGSLLVTTIVRDSGVSSATLDLWGALTEGASRLPVPDELVARMRQAGLDDARSVPLGREGLYCAFVASRR